MTKTPNVEAILEHHLKGITFSWEMGFIREDEAIATIAEFEYALGLLRSKVKVMVL